MVQDPVLALLSVLYYIMSVPGKLSIDLVKLAYELTSSLAEIVSSAFGRIVRKFFYLLGEQIEKYEPTIVSTYYSLGFGQKEPTHTTDQKKS